MTKQNKLFTNFSKNNNEQHLLSKIDKMLGNAIPNNVMGMLATVKESEDSRSLIFYDRYFLTPNGKNDYDIYDSVTKDILFRHVALLASAIHIIYCVHKKIMNSGPKEYQIYALDQQYYRCVEDVRHYKYRLKNSTDDDSIIFSSRLSNSQFKMQEIKEQLSKIF